MANTIDSNALSRPEYMLTTVDNPFDPFTQFDEWYAWDQSAGYCTPGLLARLAYVSDEISDADQALAVQQAVEAIARENVSGMHRRVQRGEVATIAAEQGDQVPPPG